MKNILLIYFSGTGNTRKIARFFQDEFRAEGAKVTLFDITSGDKLPDTRGYDITGFGYPVHAFNPPKIFYRFVRTLGALDSKYAFIFKTSGEPLRMNDGSSSALARLLRHKGYILGAERHYVMPYNIITRHSDAMAKQMYLYARALTKVHAKDILSQRLEEERIRLLPALISFVFRIEWLFTGMIGRLFSVDKTKCIGCNKCVRECPANNIGVVDGEYVFGMDCAVCMRCAFGCPADAIKIGILNGWRVNGEYAFASYIDNSDIHECGYEGGYRIYKKYFEEADKLLQEKGISL